MIEKLELINFGKFSNKVFNFSLFTLFLGDNETGKSTIFDAVVENICKPAGTNIKAKALKDRYGSGRNAIVTFKKSKDLNIPIDEFLNLYAVSSGDISVNLKDNKGWVDKVMASLITGGVNPKKIFEALKVYESDSGKLKHNKDKNELVNKIEKISEDISEKEQKRNAILALYKNIGDNQEEVIVLDTKINKLEAAIKELNESLSNQNRIREIRRCKEIMKLFIQRDGFLNNLKNNEVFKEDKSIELEEFELKLQTTKDKNIKLLSQIEAKSPIRDKIEKEILSLQVKQKEHARERHIIEELLKEVEKNINLSRNTVFNVTYIVAGLVVFGIGVGLFFSGYNIYLSAVPALIGIIILLLKSVTKGKNIDVFVSYVRDRYKDATSKDLNASDVPSLKVELYTMKQEYLGMGNIIETKTKEFSHIDAEINSAQSEAEPLKDAIDELTNKQSEWFMQKGIKTKTEYVQKVSEYKYAKTGLKEVDDRLVLEQAQLKQKNLEDMYAEIVTRIQILAANITEDEKTDEEVERLKNKSKLQVKELNDVKERKNEIIRQIDSSKGKIEGALGNFEIDTLLKDKSKLKKELNEHITQIRGGKVAAGIFSQIANDSNVVFETLSKTVSKKYGALLPSKKNVNINSTNKDDEILVEDANGVARSLENLSKGTRDLFYFALRLSLAESSSKKGGVPLLVLDEPFHHFDSIRIIKALDLLKTFQKEHGCQIVMFSKDLSLESIISDLFKNDLILHNL